jgi:hypothetical protein
VAERVSLASHCWIPTRRAGKWECSSLGEGARTRSLQLSTDEQTPKSGDTWDTCIGRETDFVFWCFGVLCFGVLVFWSDGAHPLHRAAVTVGHICKTSLAATNGFQYTNSGLQGQAKALSTFLCSYCGATFMRRQVPTYLFTLGLTPPFHVFVLLILN